MKYLIDVVLWSSNSKNISLIYSIAQNYDGKKFGGFGGQLQLSSFIHQYFVAM